MWFGLCVQSWDSSEIKCVWDYVYSRGTAVKLNVVGTMCRVVEQQ